MNPKTGILVVLAVFCALVLRYGGPDLTITFTLTIPFWFKALGAFLGFTGLILWLRRDFWRLAGPTHDAVADWLADEDEPAYTGATRKIGR